MSVQALDKEAIPDGLRPFRDRLTPRFLEARSQVIDFITQDVIPAVPEFQKQRQAELDKVSHQIWAAEPPMVNDLRKKAQARKIYNFFLPEVSGLSVLEYAPIGELLGAFPLANLAMNCTAPDTGNMEVLEKYGTPEQKEQWLKPLLAGQIRSAFAMTEPGVASSDATNISSRIERDGDDYVINGHKWWISGACRPECKVFIFLGRTSFEGALHRQQSMIIVPRDAPGVKIIRPMAVFGHEHDHAEIVFDDVRVPATNMILGEGRGFEIAQGRLGPGRIHHCMRTIGQAEAALAAILYRAQRRKAFGKVLAKQDTLRQVVAEARISIEQNRQLCYLAAVMADEVGFKAARKYIAMIKVAAPRMALKIVDDAIQVHGAHGVGQDSKLSDMYTGLRTLRVADGPDIVHLNTIAKMEMEATGDSAIGAAVSGENKNVAKYGKFKHVEGRLAPVPGSKL
eukprot:CAMPEP_0204342548 /NCGR_PEP_ID=MMETSP0469-20131031/24215_1 /ASSEMBLY_ACC=CAM_ASM_000384 /TAXON_ID=2969 /ORGANISM="Oxyrrhis marina" /LENGTH=454 /DNA_ID=CAMNT_0051327467 /DNA_START=29 /DNA_END=1393 /DNA_ORIENTATION=-